VSLTEVLVVISVLALLFALLVPSLSSARRRARRAFCQNNLRQWGVAVHCYRNDHKDYLPVEGTYQGDGISKPGTWFNALPPYLGLPPYKDFPGANEGIEELPNIHVWICPAKNLTDAYKSGSGKNQFHYGMNQVLDGLGKEPDGSRDAPGFPDRPPNKPPYADTFTRKPKTVLMFDIVWNSPAGTPRDVATMYQRSFDGNRVGEFHGDYANVLYLTGRVGHCKTDDLVTDRDFRHGNVIWDCPQLYWGYPPPSR
jgi:hypothetical protein